jgi:hypothetical protein
MIRAKLIDQPMHAAGHRGKMSIVLPNVGTARTRFRRCGGRILQLKRTSKHA